MTGELHIFDGNKPYKSSPNKAFLTKLAFRLLYTKVDLSEVAWSRGRCLDCDARGDNNPAISCMTFYCPCKFNQQLKLK